MTVYFRAGVEQAVSVKGDNFFLSVPENCPAPCSQFIMSCLVVCQRVWAVHLYVGLSVFQCVSATLILLVLTVFVATYYNSMTGIPLTASALYV